MVIEQPKTKLFPLRVVLTVTTGRLLTEPKGERDNGISDLYELLNWMTGDSLYTHQLPRASKACEPWVLQCFPELAPASVCLDKLDGWLEADRTGGQEGIKMWLAELRLLFPVIKDSYDIAPLPDGWTTIDPLIELESMVGKEKVITVTA
jgi:hypothetical protein